MIDSEVDVHRIGEPGGPIEIKNEQEAYKFMLDHSRALWDTLNAAVLKVANPYQRWLLRGRIVAYLFQCHFRVSIQAGKSMDKPIQSSETEVVN